MTRVGSQRHRRKNRLCTDKHDIQSRLHTLSCRGKAISITYSECVSVTLVMQNAMRTRLIILSSVACQTLPYTSTLYCHLWPVPLYHILPHYTVICGLSRSTIYVHIILSFVGCPALPYTSTLYCHLWPVPLYHILPHYTVICGLSRSTIFSTLSHKRYDFREKSYWT